LGIEILGKDAQNDVVSFTIEYFFSDGNSLQLGEEPGPIKVTFNNLRQGNGDLIGVWSIPFLPQLNDFLQDLSLVRVTLIDNAQNESQQIRAMLIDTPTQPDGEKCDLNRGLTRCEDGSLCELRSGGRTRCREAVKTCPDFYEVTDLTASPSQRENAWNLTGDTEGLATYGLGFCGGGTSSQLFSFTPPVAGNYRFKASGLTSAPTWGGIPDPLMWIRSHCAFSDWNAELGCNDDADRAAEDLSSLIDLSLEANDTVYIFVDGYAESVEMPGWSGTFVMSAELLNETPVPGGAMMGGAMMGGTEAGGTEAGGTEAGGTEAGGTEAGGTEAGGTEEEMK
jgi:hypothetical protein